MACTECGRDGTPLCETHWSPTPEAIKALPEPVARYIEQLLLKIESLSPSTEQQEADRNQVDLGYCQLSPEVIRATKLCATGNPGGEPCLTAGGGAPSTYAGFVLQKPLELFDNRLTKPCVRMSTMTPEYEP